MSYTKHNYKKGDELLASQLNEMDNQIASNEENLNNHDARLDILEPTAASSDVGKFLKVKTVASGKVAKYEFDSPPAPTDAQVASAVNTWLGNNIAQETGYALDRTLSVANAAAPADLVGGVENVLFSLRNSKLIYHNVFSATTASISTWFTKFMTPKQFGKDLYCVLCNLQGVSNDLDYYGYIRLSYSNNIRNNINLYRINSLIRVPIDIRWELTQMDFVGFKANSAASSAEYTQWELYIFESRYPEIQDTFLKAIKHRGGMPENTLPAYVLSANDGWKYVEGDVKTTSDGTLVLIHDRTINRTARNADGTAISTTININDITYEQALQYDFGIWQGGQFAGTKIPTFEEFIKLCRDCALHPYVDLGGLIDTPSVTKVVNMIKKYSMTRHSTIIGSAATLTTIKTLCDHMRLGLITYGATQTDIQDAINLRTGNNEVFITANWGCYDSTFISSLIENDIPFETFIVNKQTDIAVLDPYVSGMISEVFKIDDYLMNSCIGRYKTI